MHDPFSPSTVRPALSFEDAGAMLGEVGVQTGLRKEMVVETGALTSEELFEGRSREAALGVTNNPIRAIRYSHHKLAQCIASGLSVPLTAALCNYAPGRIYTLMDSPAFAELVSFYRSEEAVAIAEFADAAKSLSMDMIHLLQEKVDEHPEQFSPSMLGELIKVVADRSGNAPLNRTQNVHMHVDMGASLRAARERAATVERDRLIEGQSRPLDAP